MSDVEQGWYRRIRMARIEREETHSRWSSHTMTALVVGGAFLLAVHYRLADPLSRPLIGAEDPYTHMVILKEMAAQGFIAPSTHLNYPLYPPGLHALTLVLWTMSGASLYDVARFLPPLLGALGVAAFAAFLLDEAGPVAGAVGGALAAVMPEMVIRSNLLFPSTLDLVLIPAFFMTVALVVRGSAVATVPAALTGAALAVTHPWAMILVAPMTMGAVVVGLMLPTREEPSRLAHRAAAVAVPAALGAGAFHWWKDAEFISVGGFAEGMGRVLPLAADAIGVPRVALAIAAVAAGAGAIALGVYAWRTRRDPRRHRAIGVATGAALAAAALAIVPRLTQEPPPMVDYDAMIGAPAILLALVGVAAAGARRGFAAGLGLAASAIALPLTAIDIVGAGLWPHRAVVYLAVGVIVLAALGASAIARLLAASSEKSGYSAERVRGAVAVAVVILVVAQAAPAASGSYTWYRYYEDEEVGAIREAVLRMEEDPNAVVLVATWQPNLFLRALGDPERVVWAPWIYEDTNRRAETLERLQASGKTPYFLQDRHTWRDLALDEWGMDPLRDAPFEAEWSCCEHVALYRYTG